MNEIILEVKNLSYQVNNLVILDNISFKVYRGDYIAVVGPNGGGKSTLIHTILGLNSNYKGEIFLFGKNLKEFKEWYKIGFVPQRAIEVDTRFPITVSETIELGLKNIKKKSNKKIENQIVDEVIEILNLKHLTNRLIGELSGGQKQRVMIARALISQPELLFLDEPYTGIDTKTQKDFYELLNRLNKAKQISIIFITHDIGVIEDNINSLISINKTILKSETPRNIFNCQVMREVYGIDSHLLHHYEQPKSK